jgi:hypothetical protein
MTKTPRSLLNIALACLFLAGPAVADADDWSFNLTPYLWLPTIDGSLKYAIPPGGGGSPEISVGPTDWLDLLNYGLLVSGSATKGRLTLYTDFVLLSMTSKNDGRVLSVDDSITVPGTRIPIPISADLAVDTRTDLDGLAWTLAAGYELSEDEASSLSLILGARYFGVDVASRWDLSAEISLPGGSVILPAQGQIGADVDLWDAIAGVRGEVALLDIGTGDSDLTWNTMVGFARRFESGDLLIAYRHLNYDQDADSLLQDFSFSGPGIGYRFSF